MSLLLDALKKAALEKQRREQPNAQLNTQTNTQAGNSAASTNPPEEPKKPVSAEQIIPAIPENADPQEQTTATIAATKMDLGQLNPELEALSLVSMTPAEQAHRDEDKNLPNPDENLVFDLSEIDPVYLEPAVDSDSLKSAEAPRPESLPETGIVEGFVRRAQSREETEAAQPETPLPETPPLQIKQAHESHDPAPEPSPSVGTPDTANKDAQVKSTEANDNPLYTEDIKALFDAKSKPVEMFSAAAGKAALAQLLERSKKAANAARRRMILMYAFLSVTAILMVVFYYYLLHSEAPSVVAYVPEAPAAVEETGSVTSDTEGAEISGTGGATTNPENTASLENSVSTEDPIQAADTEIPRELAGTAETDITAGSLSAPQRPEQNAKRALEQTRQLSSATPKAPKPARDSATHQVLPPEVIPRQAMIVERNPSVDEVSEAIDRGYKAYQRGDISAAEEAYREALQQDPYQRDAMLGAAAVAVRQGREEDALNIYQQRLAREPKDQYAQSGILALSEAAGQNPELDSELSRLLLEYPDAAHLHFLKGSLYAARQQWAAAQVSFFEAWQRDNKNPDLAFNMAVALDHLAQPKEAARFYRQAISLGENRPASFSVNAVQRRLHDLEGAAQ